MENYLKDVKKIAEMMEKGEKMLDDDNKSTREKGRELKKETRELRDKLQVEQKRIDAEIEKVKHLFTDKHKERLFEMFVKFSGLEKTAIDNYIAQFFENITQEQDTEPTTTIDLTGTSWQATTKDFNYFVFDFITEDKGQMYGDEFIYSFEKDELKVDFSDGDYKNFYFKGKIDTDSMTLKQYNKNTNKQEGDVLIFYKITEDCYLLNTDIEYSYAGFLPFQIEANSKSKSNKSSNKSKIAAVNKANASWLFLLFLPFAFSKIRK